MSLLHAQQASTVQINPAGDSTGYDATGNEVISYRSVGTPKSFDADGDNIYGSDGSFFIGNGSNGNSHTDTSPSWVTNFKILGSVAVYDAYTDYDNPNLPANIIVPNRTSTGLLVSRNKNPNSWSDLLSFTITKDAPRVLSLSVVAGVSPKADGRWDPSGLRITAGSETATVTNLEITDIGLVRFDIALPEGGSETFTIQGQARALGANTSGTTLSGVLFDGYSTAIKSDTIIGVDFNRQDIYSPGWNTLSQVGSDFPAGHLVDSNDIYIDGVSFTTNQPPQSGTGTAASVSSAYPFIPSAVQENWWYEAGRGQFQFSFEGLDSDLTYDLAIGGYAPGNATQNTNRDTNWRVNGVNQSIEADSPEGSYTLFEGLTPDVDGKIAISSTNFEGNHVSTVSALELTANTSIQKPNIVIIFADDLGYGDLGCYGSTTNPTPRLDQMAAEGYRSTDMNVPANVCSPSRSALLTGRYPMRNGHPMYRQNYYAPKSGAFYALHPDEITIAEMLKPAGYHSLMIGKWHLGFDEEGSHPMDQGFDQYWGLPHNWGGTNWPTNKKLVRDRTIEKNLTSFKQVTPTYNTRVVNFLNAQPKDEPFFIYMSHQIAHSPIVPNSAFSTGNGKYANFINELDHSVGVVLDALKDNGFDENTIVVFLADNGHAGPGSSGPLSGSKYTTMEGGHRVAGIFRWPNVIPAGQVSNTTLSSMDLFPLFADLADVELPTDRVIDGKNIKDILLGHSNESKHEYIYYYNAHTLQAVRKGNWKLHLPRTKLEQPYWGGSGKGRFFFTLGQPFLVNLDNDIAERTNVAAQYPEIVEMLQEEATRIQTELGGFKQIGSDQRPGWPEAPTTYNR